MVHYPLHATNDGKFTTATGVCIDILNPTVDMINAEDIAIGLSNSCRFGGQLDEFYSVAQHSVLVSHLAPPHLKKAALIHDATEAYIHDIIKPLKNIIKDVYEPIERRFEKVIFEKFDIDIALLQEIKPFDKMALEIEHAHLRLKKYPTLFNDIFPNFKSKRMYASDIWCTTDARILFYNLLTSI